MKELFGVKDVARLFGLREARVRYWAQTGIVSPSVRQRGRAYYAFQDLLAVKVAKELLDSGLSLQSVRKNLEALRAALPKDRPSLASMRICSDGERVVVVDEGIAYEPGSGQLLLSFTVDGFSHEVAEIFPLVPASASGLASHAQDTVESAYERFQNALLAHDRGDLGEAEKLYRRAVDVDPRCAAAWTNLGNVLEKKARLGDAREAYETAIELDPEQPEARYNLANLLFDLGEDDMAVAEYQRVLLACPEFVDAHFNLGVLYAEGGVAALARTHLQHYLASDAQSDWSKTARDVLESLGT